MTDLEERIAQAWDALQSLEIARTKLVNGERLAAPELEDVHSSVEATRETLVGLWYDMVKEHEGHE